MRDWEFADKAVIESVQGNIRLSLPADFSGEVDLFSEKGRAEAGFPVERTEERGGSKSSIRPYCRSDRRWRRAAQGFFRSRKRPARSWPLKVPKFP